MEAREANVVFDLTSANDGLGNVNLVNSGGNYNSNEEVVTSKLNKRIEDQEQFRVQRLPSAINK